MSWSARIVVVAVLFHMVVRTTDILYPWPRWVDELKIERMPRPLPTRADLAKLQEESGGSCSSAFNEFQECAASLPRYWCLWPKSESFDRLQSPADWGKYSLAWTITRLQWCEGVLSIHQEWAMFAPSTSKRKDVTRARLLYTDGTETTVKARAEPEDLLSYSRIFYGKNLYFEWYVSPDGSYCVQANRGYCNWLAHQHAQNDAGAALKEIQLYHVIYRFPPPGAEMSEFLTDLGQNTRLDRPTSATPVFFRYWPPSREWEFVE